MRIAILTTQCPFVTGGAELHARALEKALCKYGHEAEIISMPFKWYPSQTIIDHMIAAKALDVSSFNGVDIDLAIGLKFPAYLMNHPNKKFWLLHQHRQAYDLWASKDTDLYDDADGRMVRNAIHAADQAELGIGRTIFANSANVARRLLAFNGIKSEPLYHPPPLASVLHCAGDEGYFLYPSRITSAKRQDFVLRALASAPGVKIVFAGIPDNRNYGEELLRLSEELDVADRVVWRGYVPNEELVTLYAHARAVVFTPIDEDLGYIALESMISSKPIITLADSGEPAALVRDHQEGLVATSNLEALAAAMSNLWQDPATAAKMGRAAFERYKELNVSWERVVDRLTASENNADHTSELLQQSSMPQLPRKDIHLSEFPSMDEVALIYRFGEMFEDHRSYYQTHWKRYSNTLEFLKKLEIRPLRILEVGSSKPFIFTTLLHMIYPNAALTVIQEGPEGVKTRMTIDARDTDASFDIDIVGLNIETNSLPFPESHFDLVVAAEVVEHLAIDPSFFFIEVKRVLNENGLFLVTTPNMTSWRSLRSVLSGGSPYSFGLFVPWNGVYGRHNREYTPDELNRLGLFSGLDTVHIETVDVYDGELPDHDVITLIHKRGWPIENRKENIIYLGRKSSAFREVQQYPPSLYSVDPTMFSAEVTLKKVEAGYDLKICNKSKHSWPASGASSVWISVGRRHQDGQYDAEYKTIELPTDLAPGDHAVIYLQTCERPGAEYFLFEFSPYLNGSGSFAGTNRIRVVTIFAQNVDVGIR